MSRKELGWLDISIEGINPEDLDIRDIIFYLTQAERILSPGKRKNHISYQLKSGSAKNRLTTKIEDVKTAEEFIAAVIETPNLSVLDRGRVRAISFLQQKSKSDNLKINIIPSTNKKMSLSVTPDTHFYLDQSIWVDSEINIYGELTDMGGSKQANVHIETKEYGVIIVDLPKEILETLEKNLMYKQVGLSVMASMNVSTGELGTKAQFIKFLNYDPSYDEDVLNNDIKKAAPHWEDVDDINEWLDDVRGIA